MNKLSKVLCALLTLTILTSCASPDGGSGINKQGGGTVIGALAGGLLGSRFGKGGGNLAAIGAGTVIGGFIGNSIGKSLDDNDRMMRDKSSQKALEVGRTGQEIQWRNPDSGHYGSVTPTRTFQDRSGEYCREYTEKITVGGEPQIAYGKACRKPDGNWQIVSSD